MSLASTPHSAATSSIFCFNSGSFEHLPRTPEPCSSAECPVSDPNSDGFYHYLYEELLSEGLATSRVFSPSLAPPNVARAFERCPRSVLSIRKRDDVASFHRQNTEPLMENPSLRWIAPLSVVADHEDNIGSIRSRVRHPFGYRNPPETIWQAFNRVKGGEASENDTEMVDSFSSEGVFVGLGIGSGVVISAKDWKVRLPGKNHRKQRKDWAKQYLQQYLQELHSQSST